MLSVNRTNLVDGFTPSTSLLNKVHERDKNECQLCGFKSKYHQEVIDTSSRYDTDDENLYVTACPICAVTQRLSKTAGDNVGYLVYLPEIKQRDINYLMHMFWASQRMAQEHEEGSTEKEESEFFYEQMNTLISSLRQGKERAIEKFGQGIEDFAQITNILFEMPEKAYRQREIFFDGLRYIPNQEYFKQHIETYAKTLYQNIVPKKRAEYLNTLILGE